ncbi:MAG: T9SS type A sorting domain-containing protein [candidate division Zixibacteria bacterium]|nr:T9SS type A sorting domain-containing protein [candidate division Zixibacteria bacterium]
MTKKLFVSLALVVLMTNFVVSAGAIAADEINYSLNFEEPELETMVLYGQPFTKVNIPNSFPIADNFGAPVSQVIPVRLLLPQGTEVERIEVIVEGTREVDAFAQGIDLAEAQPIFPFQQPIPIGQSAPSTIAKDAQAYRSSETYPSMVYKNGGVGYCRGYAILNLNVFPTEYIPSEGKLSYHSNMHIKITLKDTGYINNLYRPGNQSDRDWVSRLVNNPEVAYTYGSSGGDIAEYVGGLCDPGDNNGNGYDYVVVLKSALYDYSGTNTWNDFIARKQSEGYYITRVTVEDILAETDYENVDPTFNDTPARIREFMKDAYEDWGTEYVLIAGDQDGTNNVLRRLMYYSEEPDVESDLYWSNLDNTFNADGDSYWGEDGDSGFDEYSELFIGSIPCDTGTDLSNWMNKCFYYMDNSDQDYLENAAFYGGDTGWDSQGDDFIDYSAIKGLDDFLGPDPHYDWPYPYWMDFQYGFETWNDENSGAQYDLSVKWTAEPTNPGWSGGSESAAITGLRNAINNDEVTLLSAIAHAYEGMSMDVYDYEWEADYHNTKPFFLHDYGCHCGDMDAADDGVLHSMLFHDDTELAFATVYNTGYGWGSFYSTGSSSAIQQKSFWDYLFDMTNNSGGTGNWQMGRAQAWAKDLMAPGLTWSEADDTWRGIIESCLLFGDPAMLLKPPVVGGYVAFSFPNGRPEYVDPDGGTTIRVMVNSEGQSGTGMFYYNYGQGWQSGSMNVIGPNIYDAVFPAIPCPDTVYYYFSVEQVGGGTVYNPIGAPSNNYSAVSVLGFITTFEDNFQTDLGWNAENLGASSGDWQRGVPVNDSGWDYDPSSDGDGSGSCYLTQNETGNTDVDGGAVRLTSPDFDMSLGGTIGYEYYLYLTDESGGIDRLLVEMNDNSGAGTWYEITRHDTNGSLSWRHNDITEDDIISAGLSLTSNMRIRFTANDDDPQSIVEAGIDGFTVSSIDCGGPLPDVSINMIPDSTPVYTTQGGTFDFTGKLYNNTDQQQYTDVWIMLVLPNSNWYGPIRQWNNIPLAPNDSLVDPNANQYIPWYAMTGEYEYWAFCGDYPSAKMDSAMFDFLIFPGLAKGAGDWNLVNWFDDPEILPQVTELTGNFPNPFNAETIIKYSLAQDADVKLEVYNLLGQRVETIVDQHEQAGYKTVRWDASGYSSGVYFYKLIAGDNAFTKRMTMIK